MTIKEEFLGLLAKLRTTEIDFDEFYESVHVLVRRDLAVYYKGIEEERVREFLKYFYAYNEVSKPVNNFVGRAGREIGRVFGRATYSKEQITEEAIALEKCLNGQETSITRLIRFLGIRKSNK